MNFLVVKKMGIYKFKTIQLNFIVKFKWSKDRTFNKLNSYIHINLRKNFDVKKKIN